MTSENAVESNIETFRKRPIEVEMMLWDGTPERAEELRAWTTDALPHGGGSAFRIITSRILNSGHPAELWVAHSGGWVPLPVGTRVAKEADGNGFCPISPAAIAQTFEAVSR